MNCPFIILEINEAISHNFLRVAPGANLLSHSFAFLLSVAIFWTKLSADLYLISSMTEGAYSLRGFNLKGALERRRHEPISKLEGEKL